MFMEALASLGSGTGTRWTPSSSRDTRNLSAWSLSLMLWGMVILPLPSRETRVNLSTHPVLVYPFIKRFTHPHPFGGTAVVIHEPFSWLVARCVWVGGGSCACDEKRYVASVLVRLREYVDMMIVDPSVVSEKNK